MFVISGIIYEICFGHTLSSALSRRLLQLTHVIAKTCVFHIYDMYRLATATDKLDHGQ